MQTDTEEIGISYLFDCEIEGVHGHYYRRKVYVIVFNSERANWEGILFRARKQFCELPPVSEIIGEYKICPNIDIQAAGIPRKIYERDL